MSYPRGKITEYRVELVEREFGWLETLALTGVVVGAPSGWIWIRVQQSE